MFPFRREVIGEEDPLAAHATSLLLALKMFREDHHPLGITQMCLPANIICKANVQREIIARIGIRQFVHTGQKVLAIEERIVFSFIEILPKLRQLQRRSQINLIRRKVIVRNPLKLRQISQISEAERKVKRMTLHLVQRPGLLLRSRFLKL